MSCLDRRLHGRRPMQRGFSLIEVLVATSILATATLGLAHLLVMSVHVSHVSRVTTTTAVLAFQKMEQLWSMTRDELVASPPGALGTNRDGYFDFLDENGRVLDDGVAVPRGAVFIRRWSIEPLPLACAFLLQVDVMPAASSASSGSSRLPGEGRLVGIKRCPPAL
jgi:prepilin-type N-terminal cleavage/methylation domain-containing protein